MTITLSISSEAEAALHESASLSGRPVTEIASQLLEEAVLHPAESNAQHVNMIEHLRAIGVIGAVRSAPRADGRAWSEIEAACDAH